MYALNWLKAPKINTCSLNKKCDNNGLDLGILKLDTLYIFSFAVLTNHFLQIHQAPPDSSTFHDSGIMDSAFQSKIEETSKHFLDSLLVEPAKDENSDTKEICFTLKWKIIP